MKEYRYLGPDGEGIAELPMGVGAAIGSEYCVHLLPTAARMAAAVAEAAAKGAPLLLLTPYFRDTEMKRTLPLFRAIPPGADVDVAVNDWGLLQTIHGLFPRMRLSAGRLLTGQKRCPRIGSSPRLTEGGRKWHGEGIFSSARARAFLEGEMGVMGYHLDSLPWGASLPADAADRAFFVHSPFAIVTVTDACPWIGGKSSAEVPSCPRPCGEGHLVLREPSMGGDLLQKGKARFVAVGTGDPASGESRSAVAQVKYPVLP
ncbi:MAG: hypothetical protein C4529_01015 [Deltaproteobacteria bacterium]|nr:MAG: hypothetical protein C4529_01015 [Deltaproteobacteria bacterium]